MSDPNRGIYRKFNVERVDGSSAPGGKHHGCEYFVLDLTHDKYAPPAVRAYADACSAELPLLATDLRECADARQPLPSPAAPDAPTGDWSPDPRVDWTGVFPAPPSPVETGAPTDAGIDCGDCMYRPHRRHAACGGCAKPPAPGAPPSGATDGDGAWLDGLALRPSFLLPGGRSVWHVETDEFPRLLSLARRGLGAPKPVVVPELTAANRERLIREAAKMPGEIVRVEEPRDPLRTLVRGSTLPMLADVIGDMEKLGCRGLARDLAEQRRLLDLHSRDGAPAPAAAPTPNRSTEEVMTSAVSGLTPTQAPNHDAGQRRAVTPAVPEQSAGTAAAPPPEPGAPELREALTRLARRWHDHAEAVHDEEPHTCEDYERCALALDKLLAASPPARCQHRLIQASGRCSHGIGVGGSVRCSKCIDECEDCGAAYRVDCGDDPEPPAREGQGEGNASKNSNGSDAPPCGGSRCFRSSETGNWIHSTKSYSTCSVLAGTKGSEVGHGQAAR